MHIGATTVGTGRDWSPNVYVGDQQCIGPQLFDMLVVCSDIYVLGSPLTSAEATRMQDLASEFSKKFPAVIPPDPHSGRGRPPHALTPARPLAGRGALAPRFWDPNLGPPQLFSRGCAQLRPCALQSGFEATNLLVITNPLSQISE